MFNVNRVVDGGDFHHELQNASQVHLDLVYDIPFPCKIDLSNHNPPLCIKFVNWKKTEHLAIYASYTNHLPLNGNCDISWLDHHKGESIKLNGGRGNQPNVKNFVSSVLYITFIARNTCSIDILPVFLSSDKAQNMKTLESKQGTKVFDNFPGEGGDSKVPPQKTMIQDFQN